ncbi:hypothetical protein V6N12_033165 [Hibiscus sabdariffa]|uniref:Uncharacterized protein n=1 Tax=Hibiscus sabdariffa TaxID=183260 RepID=A0ABR2BCR5_9ROSI
MSSQEVHDKVKDTDTCSSSAVNAKLEGVLQTDISDQPHLGVEQDAHIPENIPDTNLSEVAEGTNFIASHLPAAANDESVDEQSTDNTCIPPVVSTNHHGMITRSKDGVFKPKVYHLEHSIVPTSIYEVLKHED